MAKNITAHGGELINRVASPQRAAELANEAEKLTSVTLPEREQCDVEMIGIGAFSPLTGFVGEKAHTAHAAKTEGAGNQGGARSDQRTCAGESG